MMLPQRSVLLASANGQVENRTGEKMARIAASGPNRIRSFPGIIRGGVAALMLMAMAWPTAAGAGDKFTACTRLDICYCVNSDYRDAIGANVMRVRQLIAGKKAEGKSIGYLSIPLSPAGGGSFTLNSSIAEKVAEKVTARFGGRSMFLLNPGAEAGDKMNSASGADFMYMWTQILEGPTGLGEDFDFFYFAGPTDLGKTFGLTGQGDLEALEAWFDTSRRGPRPQEIHRPGRRCQDQGRLPQLLRAACLGGLQLRLARRMEHRATDQYPPARRDGLRHRQPACHFLRRPAAVTRRIRRPDRAGRHRPLREIARLSKVAGDSRWRPAVSCSFATPRSPPQATTV
jgi:hypothetical protein